MEMEKVPSSSITSSPEIKEIGEKLVAYCSRGENLKAIDELYSDDIVSIEAADTPGMPEEMHGKDAIIEKNKLWDQENEVSECFVNGPFPKGDCFAVHFKMSGKSKRTGKTFAAEEVGLYTVRDGKVVKEEFFYTM